MIPPQAIELEEAILGILLLEFREAYDVVVETFNIPDVFYRTENQIIFSAIQQLEKTGMSVDLITVMEYLSAKGELESIGGAYKLTRLSQDIVSSANLESYCKIVFERYLSRELIKSCNETAGLAYQNNDVFELLESVENDVLKLSSGFSGKAIKSIGQSADDLFIEIIEGIENPKKAQGVPSGFQDLDAVTNGWQSPDLIILAARPAVGKTAFALNIAINAALAGKKTGFFSLEMGNKQLTERVLSTLSEVPLNFIRRMDLRESQVLKLKIATDKMRTLPLFLDDAAGLDIYQLRAKARTLRAKHGLDMLIIDYLQLMSGTDKTSIREQEISKISRGLKMLAKSMGIPIIALSQLSRAVETRSGDKGKIPQLSDLRESGAIEQDADIVGFLYRPDYHGISNDENGESLKDVCFLNIAKHRSGSLAEIKFKTDYSTQRFLNDEYDFSTVQTPQNIDYNLNPFNAFAALQPKAIDDIEIPF